MTFNPLVKAADIQAGLKQASHFLNDNVSKRTLCLSELAGMTDLGVHFVSLPPNKSGCELHHHYVDSEWFYILRGSGRLQLAPCVMESSERSGMAPLPGAVEVREVEVGPGDFAGFPGAVAGTGRAQGETPLAHTFVAGTEGMDYLVGGTRNAFDVCVYPLKGKTLLRDVVGGARAIADYGALHDVPAAAMAAEQPK
ncbi:hypothetical protein CC85DRAFT_78239 [Cutaneotrichosporon oleaginosum]|uniref:Cupin type-1 domain-containing protein n=1 Tax=Cutaneotrichosporon oleaginosum TaxID=879819 RepID=A0A0J1B4X5_9TREE|nr:uncharacterized protein CC85DRAFT_78239 [Cutaneotrichosporon oleaginosum]KLT42739.1 hypothetical protein CC85DRAFT_78239 [Cutaneotrichosporon oleaginosum]TXT09542.1 hypothetical protein COLE_03476 [Cutaneotrichosporon oleaginosum]